MAPAATIVELMERASNRRGFLRQLLDETARGVREVAPMMPGPLADAVRRIPDPPASEDHVEPTVAAPPSNESVDRAQLDELVAQAGLAGHAEAVHSLCRTSIRLTSAAEGEAGSSYLLAGGTQPEGMEPISWKGRALAVLAQIDLAELPRVGAEGTELPGDGTLLVLWDLADAPSGLSTSDAGSVAVVRLPVDHRQPNRRPRGAVRIRPSAELCLPRVWSSHVTGLGLEGHEQDAWQRLRRDLALRQGLIVADAAPKTPALAIHRLLGYPDESLGQMRQACEAAALGIDLEGRHPYEHPRAEEFESGSERWQLLFQLSVDQGLGWHWGGSRRRLYVWIDRDELCAVRFSEVWALAQ